MRFLVLGGAGYIGSHLILAARDLGHQCVVFDNLSTGYERLVPVECPFIKASIEFKGCLKDIIAKYKPDSIFHFAASALVEESTRKPELYYRNNMVGTLAVLEAICEIDAAIPFVFSSSCAVFGLPDVLPIDENAKKSPISAYGRSKLACEYLIEDVSKARGMKSIILRYFNACGADKRGRSGEMHEPETHLIPNVIKAALTGAKVRLYGYDYDTPDGTCVRDYVSVQDLAKAHLEAAFLLCGKKAPYCDAFNLGCGRPVSNLDVVKAVERATGKKVAYVFEPKRNGDPAALYADATKARETLSFRPEISLEEAVMDAFRWHMAF